MRTWGLRVIILIITLNLFVGVYGQEQAGSDAQELANKLTNWMKTELTLSEEQVSQVKEINLKYAEKMYALKRKTIPRRQKLEILKDNDAAKEQELKKVFTADQYKLYEAKKDELTKQLKQKAKERKGRR